MVAPLAAAPGPSAPARAASRAAPQTCGYTKSGGRLEGHARTGAAHSQRGVPEEGVLVDGDVDARETQLQVGAVVRDGRAGRSLGDAQKEDGRLLSTVGDPGPLAAFAAGGGRPKRARWCRGTGQGGAGRPWGHVPGRCDDGAQGVQVDRGVRGRAEVGSGGRWEQEEAERLLGGRLVGAHARPPLSHAVHGRSAGDEVALDPVQAQLRLHFGVDARAAARCGATVPIRASVRRGSASKSRGGAYGPQAVDFLFARRRELQVVQLEAVRVPVLRGRRCHALDLDGEPPKRHAHH